MKTNILLTSIVALFLAAMVIPVVSAAESAKTNFLYVLSSDRSDNVTRCFQFAKIAHSKGHNVNIFLIDDGVTWAVPGKTKGVKALTGDSAESYLDYLVKSDVPISVWVPCAKARQVGEDNLLPNAKFNSGSSLIDMAANSKVFNF